MRGSLMKLWEIKDALDLIERSSCFSDEEIKILVTDGNINRLKQKLRRLKKLAEYEPKPPEAKEMTFEQRLELLHRGEAW